MSDEGLLVGLAALVLPALYGVHAFFARLLRRLRARLRTRRAIEGERNAERLLERHGYRVERRQPGITFRPEIDGAPFEVQLRADLTVSRDGRTYVAEVKTGRRAPEVGHAPTRRQLLEYQQAYDVDGVLLVAPEQGTVREVVFPGRPLSARARGSAGRALLWFVAGAAAGAAVGARFL